MKRSYRSYKYIAPDRKEEIRQLKAENEKLKVQIRDLQKRVNALRVKASVSKIFN